MNDMVFIIAILYEIGIIDRRQALEFTKTANTESISNNLQEMQYKVANAIKRASVSPANRFPIHMEDIDAGDLIKKSK